MTSLLPASHMHPPSAVHFTNPFASRDAFPRPRDRYDWSRANGSSSRPHDLARALTPPPEMNGVTTAAAHAPKPAAYPHDDVRPFHGDYRSAQPAYRAPAPMILYPPPPPHDGAHHPTNLHHGHGVVPAPAGPPAASSRMPSPAPSSQRAGLHDPPSHSQPRRSSQAAAVAPSFRIPASVNESGGSLAELAAQITCLFWFESADVLQLVEDAPLPVAPPRPLVLDAKPTTGFLKWVTTILSTTMVAQNVVLLALLFIYRLKKLNPSVRGKPGSEYRLLTVALMLGNKFLDDNTYTNKTWAEVSGIVVGEIHVMEVEFLSNMKYCLFTSAEEWAQWQSLLGKFAAFIDRASQRPRPAPVLPPASSLNLPMALPSPPSSNQASPPYACDVAPMGSAYGPNGQHGPTPAPSPLPVIPDHSAVPHNPRKRTMDDYAAEPAPKRTGSIHQYASPAHPASDPRNLSQPVPGLNLPTLPIPASAASGHNPLATAAPGPQQLPPLNVPARAMAMVYPNCSSQASAAPQVSAPSSQPLSQYTFQYPSRQHSPYAGSAAASPTGAALPPASSSTLSLHPAVQVSPSYFLQQRHSPYRPVYNVSTLLYPPPSGALQPRQPSVEQNQMHYQPLAKPFPPAQTGRLPYTAPHPPWLDVDHHDPATPAQPWFHPYPRPPPLAQQ